MPHGVGTAALALAFAPLALAGCRDATRVVTAGDRDPGARRQLPAELLAADTPPVRPPLAERSAGGTPAPVPPAAAADDALLAGWPKPRVVLVVTGQQQGYIEPCGCTGLTNQKGGLARRATLIRQLRERGWPVVPLDVGNQVRRFGRQAEIKFQSTVEALRTMGYRAVAWGADDLRLGLGELVAAAAGADDRPSLFVSANVNLLDLTPRHQVIRLDGLTVGVTAILGTAEQARISSDEIEFSAAAEGLKSAAAALRAVPCDVYVLLAHASLDETRRLAAQLPDWDLVVSSGGAAEPSLVPEKMPGTRAVLVQVGNKGMYTGLVGIFDDPETPLRYARVPLDARLPDAREMLDVLAAYQQQLEALGLEGLGLRPIAHPSGRQFVGSEACGDCHTEAYGIWEKTPHAHATESLVHPAERSEVPRHFDPECLSCHVTGWDPQGYFPYQSGYLSLEASAHLLGNGCENCHGPGAAHAAAENGDIEATKEQLRQLRAQLRLPLAAAEQKCMECHDLDNSPDFHVPGAFEKYWKRIEHKGVD